MTTCRSKWLVLLASGVLVAPGAASAQKIGASEDSVAVRPDSTLARVHVVRAGETLWSLAATYLGDARWWRELLLLNRAVLHDAQHLEPGTRLVLPGRARAPSTMRVANGRATLPVASISDDHDARFEGRTVFFGSKHTGLASRDQQSADAASQHADTLGSGIFQLSRAPSTLALAAPIAPSASMHASSSRARMPSIWERVAAPWIDVMGGPLLAGRILRGIDTPAVVAAEGASDLHLFDVVHITPPQGAPTLVGTRYLAFRLGQILLGHGQVVIPVGIVRVDRVGSGDSRAQATLVAKFSAVAEGVGLVLLDVGDATDSSTTRQISPRSLFPPSSHSSSRSPRTLHTQSEVLSVMSDAALPTVQHIVLIGAGRTQGVHPGDRVDLFADEAARDRAEPADSADSADHGIATAVVLRVSEKGASAVIVRQAQPAIRVGSPVRVTLTLP